MDSPDLRSVFGLYFYLNRSYMYKFTFLEHTVSHTVSADVMYSPAFNGVPWKGRELYN